MNGLMLIGFAIGRVEKLSETAVHQLIYGAAWSAVALDVDPEMADSPEGLMMWAKLQNEVLNRYHLVCDVIPIALGAVFSTERALCEYVSANKRAMTEVANRLKGFSEYSIKVMAKNVHDEKSHETVAESGTSYLRTKLGHRRDRQKLYSDRSHFLSNINEIVGSFSSADQQRILQKNDALLCQTILVRKEDEADMISRLMKLSDCANGLSLTCKIHGPSPAYSFSHF